MAVLVLTNAKVWLGAYDVSGRLNELGLEYAADIKDKTVFGGDGTRSHIAGLKSVKSSLSGFVDLDELDAVLHGNLAVSNVPMSMSPDGGEEGELAFFYRAVQGSYSREGEIGELYGFSVAAEASGGEGLIRGTIMANVLAADANAEETARQLGAVGSGEYLYAALHVLRLDGTDPTLDVTVESDNAEGFATPATRITFSQKTAIGSEWATPVAGPITDDWWRIAFEIGGTTPEFDFVVVVGIQ